MIGPTEAADIPAIVALHVACWRHNFRGLIDHQALESIDVADWIRRRREHYANPERLKFVARDPDGRVLGFAEGGRSRDSAYASDGELYALYVDPTEQGRGTGARLFGAMADALRAKRFPRMMVKTMLNNPASRGFYEARGARFAGTGTFAFYGKAYPEAIYLFDWR